MESKNKLNEESFIFNDSILMDEHAEAASSRSIVFDESDQENRATTSSFSPTSVLCDLPGSSTKKHKNCSDIVSNFTGGITQLDINESTKDKIFELSETLIEEVQLFCDRFIKTKGCDPLEALDVAMSMFLNQLKTQNSDYKRHKSVRSKKEYVKPKQFRIGTHWEFKRSKDDKTAVPHHTQSSFSFVSPLERIHKMFTRPHIHDMYFEYNKKLKHLCTPNVYKDFCCGTIYQNTELFRKYPDSLQLQLFIDGFEIASPLKTKTTIHSQVAIYMNIRNMPQRFAYNLNNIHLVCLINENDLKKAQTSYNDVWKLIVSEIKILETTGINLESGENLKGTIIEIFYYLSNILI